MRWGPLGKAFVNGAGRAIWISLALTITASSCVATQPSGTDPGPEARPSNEGIRNERFIVKGGGWKPRNLDRRVPIEATLVNHSENVRTPTCYLVDRTVGLIELDDPSPMQAGEERAIRGTASFPIPTFNYECDGLCKGVKCVVRGQEPRYIKHYLSTYARIPPPGARVSLPNLDGKELYKIGYPLYRRGLHVRISKALVDAWGRNRGSGRPAPQDPKEELRLVLMDLLLQPGPKVRLNPGPGTEVKVGSVVVLEPY